MNEQMHKDLGLLRKSTGSMYKRMPVWTEGKGELPERDLSAIGFTCGIGSMLIGAREAGFSVLGNIEWRDYYRLLDENGRNTFTENFPGAFFARGFRDMDPFVEYDLRRRRIDLAMGHPECGKYSLLNSMNKNPSDAKRDAGDIPLFLEYVADLKPRYFVMDDLPQSFIALPMSKYHDILPDYDLFPEWISNYNYGNPQKNRKRMFMIGSLKSEGYAFVPGEEDKHPNWTVLERIGDIDSMYGLIPNHDPHVVTGRSSRFTNMRYRGDKPNWGEVQEYFKKNQKGGQNFRYHGANGFKVRPALIRMKYDYPSPTLTGGNPHMHPSVCLPLSVRERARIQGFPDDFIFYGTRLTEEGEWEHNNHNMIMVKQTGKAMPVEFNRFVAKQIATHIRGKKIRASNQRYLKSDFHISKAKTWFCEQVGYANQEKACKSCWLYDSCDLPRKTGEKVPLDLEGLM